MNLLLPLLISGAAHATAPDKFGIGGRWQGAGGGGVAIVDDGTAALLNPAGLSKVRRPTAAIGFSAGTPRFHKVPPLWWDTNRDGAINELDKPLNYSADVDPVVGMQLQVARHVGGKFGLGLTAYVPTKGLIRFSTFDPSLPTYFMWDNRPQRYVAAAGIGGDILPGLSVGAAVDMLAKVRIDLKIQLDAQVTGPEANDETTEDLISDVVIDVQDIQLDVVPAFAPVFGLQWDVGETIPEAKGVVLGAAYRGAVGIDIGVNMDIQADLEASDIGELDPFLTAIIIETALGLNDHYQPARVAIGGAYRRGDTLAVYLDGRWTRWSAMFDKINIAQVQKTKITSPFIDISDKVVDGNDYTISLRDTWSLRTGGDIAFPKKELKGKLQYVRVAVRGGFGFEPTPLVSQGKETAFLDTDRSMYTLGAGVEVWDPFALVDGPLRLDVFGQYHALPTRPLPHSSDTPQAGYPVDGDVIDVGGSIIMTGVQFGFDY